MTEDISGLSLKIEKCRLATKLSFVALVISFALWLLALLAGPVYAWAGLDVFSLGVIPFGLAALFSASSLVRSLLMSKATLEEEEKILLEKRKETKNSIMDVSEDVRFTAGRSLANYEKYAPSSLAFLGFLASGLVLYFLWHGWAGRIGGSPLPENPLNLAFVSALCMGLSVFAGAFLIGQSQVSEFRWLRPVGAWLVAGFGVMSLAALVSLLLKFGIGGWEVPVSKLAVFVLAVLALEFLFSFITEFYRPRTQLEDRPVYESRLLSLFTEPGGVVRNIAETLDYQFGFKVSKTWIYDYLQRYLLPGVIVWLFALWLFTGISDVPPGELGVRERFGALVDGGKAWGPGVHFKLPFPFERVIRVPVDKIQEVVVGVSYTDPSSAKSKPPQVVLWTSQHYAKEGGFLVANDSPSAERDVANAVSVLDAAMPVHYRVRPEAAADYAVKFDDMEKILRGVGEREATKYFASTDFIKAMCSNRESVAKDLEKRIQAEADKLKLGVEIVLVNLHDVHPPVEEVAPAFQDVLCAQEQKEAAILEAESYKLRAMAETKVADMGIRMQAGAYKYNAAIVSAAEAERFKRQLAAYNSMPSIFKLRTYLEFLETDCKELRKYVVSASMPYQIYEINMEEKARLDLLDANIGELAK